MKKYIKIFLIPIFYILRLFIQKENIILFSSSDTNRYSGNTKYLFEYFNAHCKDRCYWITESEDVKKYLQSQGYKFISNNNLLYKLYIILKSKVIFSSGTSFYDPFNIISLDKKIIKICTMHGTGPKLTIERSEILKKTLKLISDINSYDYVSFSTEYACKIIGVNQLVLPISKTKTLGTPKQDILHNKKYIEENYNRKKIVKGLFGSSYDNQKIIYYAPTFRSYQSELPMKKINQFDEDDFNSFLEKNNLFLLYSYHSMSNFKNGFKKTNNIKFIDITSNHLFDNIQLMTEIDLLIGDYSTLSTDFTLLKRPQIFVMPDYDKVSKSKGFAEELRHILPGEEVTNYNNLCKSILASINNPKFYLTKFDDNISKLSEKYIEDTCMSSCQKYLEFYEKINN